MKKLLLKLLGFVKENKKKVAGGLAGLLGLIGIVLAPEQAQEILEGLLAVVDVVNAE